MDEPLSKGPPIRAAGCARWGTALGRGRLSYRRDCERETTRDCGKSRRLGAHIPPSHSVVTSKVIDSRRPIGTLGFRLSSRVRAIMIILKA